MLNSAPWEGQAPEALGWVVELQRTTPAAIAATPEAVKKFNGRDALLRVRDGKLTTDAQQRVLTESGLRAQTNDSHLASQGRGFSEDVS